VRATNESRGSVLAERVEVGASLWAKFMGLMGRASLPAGDALWLPGDNGIHMFFMRFPIDAVFLGRPSGDGAGGEGERGGARPVVSVSRALRPWTGIVPFVRGADGVLELPAGTIDETGTERGDLIRIA
jgi:uncharacterized membrane protein (UPF0127 family)